MITTSPPTSGGGETALLVEYEVLTDGVTSIDFTGLDINTHKRYRVELELDPIGGGAYGCYVNGDTVASNYYTQIMTSYSTTLTQAYYQNNYMSFITANEKCINIADIFLFKGQYQSNTKGNSKEGNLAQNLIFSSCSGVTVHTNITQLTFIPNFAEGFRAGTKIRIYKGN